MMSNFKSEEEALKWIQSNIPLFIKPKGKSKTLFVSPFKSYHAFDEVCKHLAQKLYNHEQNKI